MQEFGERENVVAEILDRIRERLSSHEHSTPTQSHVQRLCIDSLLDVLKALDPLVSQAGRSHEVLRQLVQKFEAFDEALPVGKALGDAAFLSREGLGLEPRQLQCIFSATTNLVVVTNAEGMVTHLNPAAEQFLPGVTGKTYSSGICSNCLARG